MKKILILTFMILMSNLLFAEGLNKLSVIGKAKKSSAIISASKVDANNRKAACIVFLTDLDVDMDFVPNIELIDLISKTGRHEVYVQPAERVIEVLAVGFKPFNLVLSSYGIRRLDSGEVYEIEINKKVKDEKKISRVNL